MLLLLLDGRCHPLIEEKEFGAEQTDTLRPRCECPGSTPGRPEVGEQGNERPVGERARTRAALQCSSALLDPPIGLGLLVDIRADRDKAVRRIHDHLGSIGQRIRACDADDGDDRLLAGEDRRVRGGATLSGDQRKHLPEIEERGVCRREVVCDEHERHLGVGNARRMTARE